MPKYISPALDHPAYHQDVKLRGYNCRTTAVGAVTPADRARVLRRLNPDWTRTEHLELAARHLAESQRLNELHTKLLDEAHLAAFGVPRQFHDYRITAIGREEYAPESKEMLRQAAYGSTEHSRLASAHMAASKRAAH